MDEEPIPLATYASVLAHLIAHRDRPLGELLAGLGLSAEQFHKADAYFNERLRESQRLRKGVLAMTFAAAFAEARLIQGLFAASPGPAPTFASAAAEPPPAALPSYLSAPSPSSLSVASVGWQAPVNLPPPVHAPLPMNVPPPAMPVVQMPPHALSVTMAAPAPTTAEMPIAKGPPSAMPFRQAAPGEALPPASAAAPSWTPPPASPLGNTMPATMPAGIRLGGSAGLGTSSRLASKETPRPADMPWDQAASRVGKLTLAHYAALTIELSRDPPDPAAVLQRYGLSNQEDLRHVNAAFQTQMQFDPALRAQYDALIGRMRSMSSKRE